MTKSWDTGTYETAFKNGSLGGGIIFSKYYYKMMKSDSEHLKQPLYESFLPPLPRLEKQITFQNKVIGICLLVLLVGAVGILCLLIL